MYVGSQEDYVAGVVNEIESWAHSAIPSHHILLKPDLLTSRDKVGTLCPLYVVGDTTADISGEDYLVEGTLAGCWVLCCARDTDFPGRWKSVMRELPMGEVRNNRVDLYGRWRD